MKAIWKGKVIAESDSVKMVESNHYFPMNDIKKEYFKESNLRTRCPWKGEAFYYDIQVNDSINKDAAWYYPKTSHAARPIENHVAFWKGVEIQE